MVFHLLLLVSVVICSPIPPSPTVPQIEEEVLNDHRKDIVLNNDPIKTTQALTSPTGSSGQEPEVSVTSEVRTVSLRIAEGGVPMMKHNMIPPMIFGKPEETFIEPTEVEAPGSTPTVSSLVTSIPSKIVFVRPIPASHEDDKARALPISEPVPTINGNPENITIISSDKEINETIPIIKSVNTAVYPETQSHHDSISSGFLNVSRDKRIFPSTSDLEISEKSFSKESISEQSHTDESTETTEQPELSHANPSLNISKNNTQTLTVDNLNPFNISGRPLKLEARQANEASYYSTEIPEGSEEVEKFPSNTEVTHRIPALRDRASLSQDDLKLKQAIKIETMEPSGVSPKIKISTRNKDSKELEYEKPTEAMTSKNPTTVFQTDENETDSDVTFQISEMKEKLDIDRKPRLEKTNPDSLQPELLTEEIPSNSAHLNPGVPHSRSLEPILDSFSTETFNNTPSEEAETEDAKSQKIKDNLILYGILYPITMGIIIGGLALFKISAMKHSGIRPKHLTNTRSSSTSESDGYFDDQCRVTYLNSQLDVSKGTPDDLVSLDNDSFLNSLESMTIQNLWTDNIKHTKL